MEARSAGDGEHGPCSSRVPSASKLAHALRSCDAGECFSTRPAIPAVVSSSTMNAISRCACRRGRKAIVAAAADDDLSLRTRLSATSPPCATLSKSTSVPRVGLRSRSDKDAFAWKEPAVDSIGSSFPNASTTRPCRPAEIARM